MKIYQYSELLDVGYNNSINHKLNSFFLPLSTFNFLQTNKIEGFVVRFHPLFNILQSSKPTLLQIEIQKKPASIRNGTQSHNPKGKTPRTLPKPLNFRTQKQRPGLVTHIEIYGTPISTRPTKKGAFSRKIRFRMWTCCSGSIPADLNCK